MSASLQARDANANDLLLQLVASPFQAAFQIDAFWASLGTSIVISVVLTLIFSLLRPRHTLVYAPKIKHADAKHAPPPLGRGPFAWFMPTLRTKEDVLVDKIGMDAVFFLRFLRMLRNIFCVLAVVGILIMIPVNVVLSKQASYGVVGAFAIMTPLNVWGNGLWAQVVVAYVVDITVACFLWLNYRQLYRLRRNYFKSPDFQRSLHARSLLIRDIPAKLRSDEGILRLTDDVNPTGVLPKATIGRNVKILPDLIEEHEETVRKLETVLAKYLKTPDRLPVNRPSMRPPKHYKGATSGGKIDAISYLTERIRQLENQIEDVRERVDKRDAVGYGFATWEQISQAHTVAFSARKKSPHGTKIRLAPRPNDLIWKNLTLTKGTRGRKRFFNAIWITLLTFIWTPFNAAIAIFLSNLSNLGSVWPRFQQSLIRHRTWWALVQGIASPALTSLVYLILPIIFRRMQIRAGDVTKTSRERHVLRNLYNFFIFNNLIVFSLFSAIWQYVTAVIKDSSQQSAWDAIKNGEILVKVMTALCLISPFWVIWLLQRNLGATIDLAQLWTLFYVWFARTFLSPTPRQNIEWTAPPAFDYASYYNYFLFYATIALCFSTLQPVILVVTAIYFTLDSVLKKYLLMYVFVTKTESGGQFWRPLFNRLVFATILSNCFIALVIGARGTYTMLGAMVPPVLFMLGFKIYCVRTFDPGMHYYHRSGMQTGDLENTSEAGASAKAINYASLKYRHPALEQRLITPMVSAKARHVLAQIYSGRLSDAGAVSEFTDIAMEPMTQSGKPPQDTPFEIVPEAQQDFQYYKNRSDFREEGGEIYGRPEDFITERSGTPMSYMTSSTAPVPNPYSDGVGPIDHKDGFVDVHPPTDTPPRHASPIPRRAVNTGNLQPSVRNNMGYSSTNLLGQEGDLSVRHGTYTDPNDDTTNLLRGAGDLRTPNGEFMSMDRWQTQGSAEGSRVNTPGINSGGTYDYFRNQNKGYRGL